MKKVIILLIVIFSLSLFLGCQKKAEKVVKEPVEQVEKATEEAVKDTEAVEEEVIAIEETEKETEEK